MRRVLVVVSGCVVLAFAIAASVAAAKHAPPRVSTVRLHWRLTANRDVGVYTDHGRYLFLLSDQLTGAGVLIDDRTGARTSIVPPGEDCGTVVGLSARWLAFRCFGSSNAETMELYRLATGQWSSFDYSDQSRHACAAYNDANCLRPLAIGTDWVEFAVADPQIDHPCNTWWGFENLRTRQWRQTDQPPCYTSSEPLYHAQMTGLSAHTMLNLDAPKLLSPVCAPVRLPAQGELDITSNGVSSPVQTYGRYELVGDPVATTTPQLWHCGHPHPSRVPWPGGGTARLLAWRVGTNKLTGLLLTTGQRFVSSLHNLLPPSQGGLMVGVHHIYAFDNNGHVWATPIPSLPKAS